MSKLQTPGVSDALVMRERLLSCLSGALRSKHRLSVIAAPAGYGKSTLAAQWAERITRVDDDAACAWVALGADADDGARFSECLLAALSLAGVDCTDHMGANGDAATLLLNVLSSVTRRLTLVLDDYHVITAPAIHAFVQALIERMPEQLHVVLISRHKPTLALGRLRALRQLTELGAGDLRFTLEEARSLLNGVLELGLPDADIALLHEKTEGWAAGLYLASLAVKQHTSASCAGARALIHQIGRHRFIQDYLREEAFDLHDEATRQFLLQTSLLDQLDAQSCNTVTARADSHGMLMRLADHNGFIQPAGHLSDAWRHHPLFAEFLRDQLRTSFGECLYELEQRAKACQCEPRGMPPARLNAATEHCQSRVNLLSAREMEVVRLMADGLSNHEIARRICVAPGTVKRHVHNIFGKLDARNRVEAVAHVRRMSAGAQA